MKQGVFWVIPSNDFEILYRFNDTAGHKEIWEEIIKERSDLKNFDYEHFPRGRIWEQNEISIVFLNPILNTPEILYRLKNIFCLTDNYKVITDSSI